jgi:hypothetical protein
MVGMVGMPVGDGRCERALEDLNCPWTGNVAV